MDLRTTSNTSHTHLWTIFALFFLFFAAFSYENAKSLPCVVRSVNNAPTHSLRLPEHVHTIFTSWLNSFVYSMIPISFLFFWFMVGINGCNLWSNLCANTFTHITGAFSLFLFDFTSLNLPVHDYVLELGFCSYDFSNSYEFWSILYMDLLAPTCRTRIWGAYSSNRTASRSNFGLKWGLGFLISDLGLRGILVISPLILFLWL